MTDFLFSQPSFLSGCARVLDLGAQLDGYNESPSPASADARAMYADWLAVGKDIIAAFNLLPQGSEKSV